MTNKAMTDTQKLSYELMISCGTWKVEATDLALTYNLDRVKEVIDYIINRCDYNQPGAAIVLALQEEWEISPEKVDVEYVNKLLNRSDK